MHQIDEDTMKIVTKADGDREERCSLKEKKEESIETQHDPLRMRNSGPEDEG